MEQGIVIEPVEGIEGFRECERLQREVWGCEDIAVVPDHAILVMVEAGGLVLGAFAGEGGRREMVGFVLSLFGRTGEGRLRHYSYMAAVKEGFRDRGVGYRLKLAQREHVLKQGIDLITWTFDPLESRNAHFNLNKLGGVATRYLENFYGTLRDKLNLNLPTDRLLCEWHLVSPRVERRLEGGFPGYPESLPEGIPVVNAARGLEPGPPDLGLREERLLLEIPADFSAVKRESTGLALKWRLSVREALNHYMGELGYLATGLVRSGGRSFLLLERRPLEEVLSGP